MVGIIIPILVIIKSIRVTSFITTHLGVTKAIPQLVGSKSLHHRLAFGYPKEVVVPLATQEFS